jgi:hypothetical protein
VLRGLKDLKASWDFKVHKVLREIKVSRDFRETKVL